MRQVTGATRATLLSDAATRRLIARDAALDALADALPPPPPATPIEPRANVHAPFPSLPAADRRARLARARGLVDLSKVVVVFGFGELGPYGGARTRWEYETYGEFSIEGVVELAWVCGLIKGGADGGWVDAQSGESGKLGREG